MKLAYSYQRFSKLSQSDGDSLRRQTEAARAFCRQHGLTLMDTFKDEGISAFKGKNFNDETALSQFLKLVHTGTIQQGSVLVVESLDRISRQDIWPCFDVFKSILKAGVGVGVLSLNRIFDYDSINKNPMELILAIVEFSRAGNESQMKSERSKGAITGKVERIKNGEKFIIGGHKPTWILGCPNGKWLLDVEKVKVIKDIFHRYLAGKSCTRIANELNTEGVPSFKRRKGVWTQFVVRLLLGNRNVIGDFKMRDTTVENYYPQIINHADFLSVKQKLAFNENNRGGSKYGLVRNLFKGLMTCSDCGGRIELVNVPYKNVAGEVIHYQNYLCAGVLHKTKCSNKGRINVTKFETNFFDFIFMAKIHGLKQSKQENPKLTELKNDFAKVELKIQRVVKLLDNDDLQDMAELASSLTAWKKERETIKRNIEIEEAQSVSKDNAPKAAKSLLELKRKETLGETITDTEERTKARNLMPSLYQRITLKFGEKDTTAIFYGVDGNEDKMILKK